MSTTRRVRQGPSVVKRVRIEEAVEGTEMVVGGKGDRKRDFISSGDGGGAGGSFLGTLDRCLAS